MVDFDKVVVGLGTQVDSQKVRGNWKHRVDIELVADGDWVKRMERGNLREEPLKYWAGMGKCIDGNLPGLAPRVGAYSY